MGRTWNLGLLVRAAVILVTLLAPRSGTSQGAAKKAIVITMEKAGRGVTCRVDSQSFGDLLSAYGSVLKRHGSDQPVAVLIDDALPISWIWVAPSLANKAPLTNVRVFVVMRESDRMFEIKDTPSLPLGAPIE